MLGDWDFFFSQLRNAQHKAQTFAEIVNIIIKRDPNIMCPSDQEFWKILNQEAMVHFQNMQQRNFEFMINGLNINQEEIIH